MTGAVARTGRTVVSARRVVAPDRVLTDHQVTMAEGRIVAIGPAEVPVTDDILAPGFVDIQVNGHDDVDVATITDTDWPRMNTLLLAQGVTTWCPTLITTDRSNYAERLAHLAEYARTANAADGAPSLAGVHLEGPYLGDRHGAHTGVPSGPIDLAWLADLPPIVRLVTLGPERSNAIDAIRMLTDHGIAASLGHTAATYERTREAIDAGARGFTHCFNAASPMHHREPGPITAVLGDDRVYVGMIVDGVHVHPAMVDLVRRAKPHDRVVFVTDATAWRSGRLAHRAVELRDGAPRLADGTLAGSCLTMNRAVQIALERCGFDLVDAIRAASTNPARQLGLDDRGTIEIGARADVVALTDDFDVAATWVAGTSTTR